MYNCTNQCCTCLDLKPNRLSAVVKNCSQRKRIKDSNTFDNNIIII